MKVLKKVVPPINKLVAACESCNLHMEIAPRGLHFSAFDYVCVPVCLHQIQHHMFAMRQIRTASIYRALPTELPGHSHVYSNSTERTTTQSKGHKKLHMNARCSRTFASQHKVILHVYARAHSGL